MSPLGWLAFVAAGAVGAPVRYLVDGAISDRTHRAFPWGTFVVNATGSLVLGFVTGLALYHGLPDAPKTVLGTGFCGAYTTFSTHTFETVRLAQDGARARAIGNALGTLAAGTGAAALGLGLAAL
ncbi:MAG TPA: fluoride efflux transporter CrcB [Acidimicrobiales bacterium]